MEFGRPNVFNNGTIKSIALGRLPTNTIFRLNKKFYHKYSDHLAYVLDKNTKRTNFLEIDPKSYLMLVAIKAKNN
ncbi:hypothetical protein [Flavobacterium sp.]|uniref:hypothetical protein n=1 Tax=Flavobacterium sp. TaxID=239 RepID=UPI0038FCB9B3